MKLSQKFPLSILSTAMTLLSLLVLVSACAPAGQVSPAPTPQIFPANEPPSQTTNTANPTSPATPANGSSAGHDAVELPGKEQGKTDVADDQASAFIATVHFDFDRSEIRSGDARILDALIERVAGYQEIASIRIEGHADHIGTDAYNFRLSRRRALAVRDYLVARSAVMFTVPLNPTLMEIVAKGESEPVTRACPTDANRNDQIHCLAPDRRAEVEIQVRLARALLSGL